MTDKVDGVKDIYDVVIVGAGIQGCGVAQACALNGLKTLVIERNSEVAMETSQASSKLIHGGLRYLQTAQFGLVKECLQEQKTLLEIAPNLVKTKRFIIPIYKDSQRSHWLIHIGLSIYSFLKGDWSLQTFGRLHELPQDLSGIEREDLQCAYFYEDAQTDDQLLTQAVAHSALEHGAEFSFNQNIKAIKYLEGEYRLTISNSVEDGSTSNVVIKSKSLVNAAGPWSNAIAQLLDPKALTMPYDLVQGVHLLIDRPAFENCLYLESPKDSRPVFILPWKNKVLIGTTERLYSNLTNDKSKQKIHNEDMAYLLNTFNHYFPSAKVSNSEVLKITSGLRVLNTGSEDENSRSRDVLIQSDSAYPGYVAIVGGKLTAYRATAENVMNNIAGTLGLSFPLVNTGTVALSKGFKLNKD